MTNGNFDWWFEIWLAGLGTPSLVFGTYFFLSKQTNESHRPPLQWLLVVSGLAFGIGLFQVVDLGDDTCRDCLLLNLLIFLPLLLLGMIVGNMFLVFLGGVGFLADDARFTAFCRDHVSVDAREPVSFLVFALTGLAAGSLGFKLTKYQPTVQDAVSYVVGRIDASLHNETSQGEGHEEQSLALLDVSPRDSTEEEIIPEQLHPGYETDD